MTPLTESSLTESSLSESSLSETQFAGTVRTAAARVHSFLLVVSNGVSFGNGPVPAVVRV